MNATRDPRFIEGVLNHLPLFWGVTPVHLQLIARQSWLLPAPRGETLVHAGARVPGVFAVAYGAVKLALRNGGAEERLLRVAAARHVFGEASALLGQPSPYHAVTLTETKLVVMPTAPLMDLIERDPRFALGLVMSLARGKVELCAEVASAALHTGVQRLAGYIIVELNGSGDRVQLTSSKTLLAARLGMKKETLSRLLARLGREGVIEMRGREIAILDRARLVELAA
jgi:CRP/FNR family transcriptional regulator, dissimilatory nitrate respiration regulator